MSHPCSVFHAVPYLASMSLPVIFLKAFQEKKRTTVVSRGAEAQASAFKKSTLSAEPVHKMDHQQNQSPLKNTCVSDRRGPQNRCGFPSNEKKNSNSYFHFSQFPIPGWPNCPLFPHRIDVPLVDPCSGFVSPGADADLQPNVGRVIESLVDYSDVKPHQRIPIGGQSGQTAHKRHMILLQETSQNRRWNSRSVPAASVKAELRGWRAPVKAAPSLPDRSHIFAFCVEPSLKESSDPSARRREEKARNYFYKSSTQKAYEEVPWDDILPSKIQPPESTVEELADPVSQCFTKRRYNPEPEISQLVGGFWDRFQRRSFTSPQRPINFVSQSSRTGHIPLYTGCVGAVDFEDIDNADADLILLNHVRTSKPRYTSTAYTPNIPGYTGKVHWSATHPANSNFPSTNPSVIAQTHGYIAKDGSLSQYNQRRFSEMVTPNSIQNSFNKREQETITV
ncbi:spermatogenesis-associated protein 48 [Apus apus]|uniref:spermatogenesis-associated protein 48 n=1 Tax=Apus apus TaxID=8895 RepID=UPI0021F855BB|nr:spermatogenesis-associated protein 48 [Apus apus]